MENTKERSTTGECSVPHSIQHIHERSANLRWNEEFHIHRHLYITAQYSTFQEVEQIIETALGELTHYYGSNSLRANPDKTQVTAFSSAEQRDQEVATRIMEWSGPGEH